MTIGNEFNESWDIRICPYIPALKIGNTYVDVGYANSF